MLSWVAWSYHGKWYTWGGSNPAGIDCSGFIVELGKSIGIIYRQDDFSSAGLWEALKQYRIPTPKTGGLVFYGDGEGNVNHVEFCLDDFHSMGASGGGSWIKTTEDAIKANAFIKVRPIKRKREIIGYTDFAGVEGFLEH